MAEMMQAALVYDYDLRDGAVFGDAQQERFGRLVDLYPEVVNGRNFEDHAAALKDVEVLFGTWGFPKLEERHFAAMPSLKAVFYAAGNVKAFAEPLVERDVVLVSAWAANAIPVAGMCLAQILLSLRGYFRTVRQYRERQTLSGAKDFRRPGVNGEVIGLIGLGFIGTRLCHLLRGYPLRVIAHDPCLTAVRADELDVERVSLEEIFERALIVSNHIPDIPSTRRALTGTHFASMREGATFINTGRGAQVVEDELVRVLEERLDLTALLDVTWPEPPAEGSPLWTLPNVVISPHIGGTIGDEVTRLADLAIEEFERWHAGHPLRYRVTRDVLATMG